MTRPALLLLFLLLVLAAALPAPHPEARLFSAGWGAASYIDPNFCLTPMAGQPQRLALFAKTPAVAPALDRLALALRYLAWGLVLPIAALAAVCHPQGGARHPALLSFGLLGAAPAWFQWPLNPAFVGLRQTLAEAWLARWPLSEDQFVWLDAGALGLWLAGGTLLAGGASFTAVRIAAGLARVDWRRLAADLVPLAALALFLGLTQESALYLRGEGAPLHWLSGLRAALLALAVVWSVVRGWRTIEKLGTGGTAAKAAAGLLWLVPAALVVLHGWLVFFHWTSRYHV